MGNSIQIQLNIKFDGVKAQKHLAPNFKMPMVSLTVNISFVFWRQILSRDQQLAMNQTLKRFRMAKDKYSCLDVARK